ncbi:alpha/beta-hydrolase [Penicillium odoratum]|uniref:alpha/beta-hydrolase n=1 Tax=Penicillium odoratum TaxID=1167516 RepID=UPI0025494E06|nr:alpha/beta-hydrolase [Penicillium odoratum]KAJ5769548.1 alpha/beta-hydrolase [Penicillium odoratum]
MPLQVGSIEVLQRPVEPPETSDPHYDDSQSSTTILPEHYRKGPNAAPFQAATVFEKDVKISLRDGTKIRADIFRPHGVVEPVPALIAWSPYGKSGRVGHFNLSIIPGRVGVPEDRVSGFEKFEAPDPAEWTARGYAIVNADSRGVYDSEGDIRWLGSAEGQDGYDAVEEISKMPWCSGSVGLVGNSWLGMAQWFIAAERPPHLKCIAPLEGASDMYRELWCRGGIPQWPFWEFLAQVMCGRSRQEDVKGMLEKYPLMNEYWEDKRAKISQISVPTYVLASYSTFLHTMGSFRGFEELDHEQKWLRVHATQEWHDLYKSSTNDELQMFFDRYMKGIQNGWEMTPRVRVSLLQFNKEPMVNVNFENWPVPSAKFETLHLAANGLLSKDAPTQAECLSYQSDVESLQMDSDGEELCFEYIFPRKSCILGCARAVLHMSCMDFDDMDVFVQLRKADKEGNMLQNINIPLHDLQMDAAEVENVNPLKYLGPTGALRASHRAIDERLSTTSWPEHDYTFRNPVTRGEVVKLDIGIWQTGIIFDAGERLILKVSGHNMTLAEFPTLRGRLAAKNSGRHSLHLGGSHKSHLVIPLVDLEKILDIKTHRGDK